MSDFNKKFLIRASGKTNFLLNFHKVTDFVECHLGTSLSEENWDKEIIGVSDMENFLHIRDKLTLYAFVEEKNNQKKLKFVEQILPDYNNNNKIVVFSKKNPTALTEANIFSSLEITSVSGPPTLALYHTLTKVFTPLLTQV